MSMRPLTRRVIAALLLVLLTACYSWQPTTVSPQRLIAEDQPSSVRVTLTNGETVTIENPTVRNDSIVALTGGVTGFVGVASRDVRLLEVQRSDSGKTIGAVVLTAVGAAVVLRGARASGFSRGGTAGRSGNGPLP